MKKSDIFLVGIMLFIIIQVGQSQNALDIYGDLIIRDNFPALILYDLDDHRNKGLLWESSDDIQLVSYIGGIDLVSVGGDLKFFAGGSFVEKQRLTILASNGNVGIGNISPDEPLSFGTTLGPKINLYDASGIYGFGMASAELQIGTFDNTKHISLGHYSGSAKTFVEWIEINSSSLVMTNSGAHVTAGGVWTDASSRSFKENIIDLTLEEASLALEQLNPVKFNYLLQNDEEYIGFIAEDVPDLVATNDRKGLSSMDIVAVLTKVVQEQQSEIDDLKIHIAELRSLIEIQIKK